MEAESSDSSRSRSSSLQREDTTVIDAQVTVRGIAKTRGNRGRGRSINRRGGRSGKRGGNQRNQPNRRNRERQERISNLNIEELRTLVNEMVISHPGYVFDILDRQGAPSVPCGGHHPTPNDNRPDWCVCSFCRDMPTETERECCGRGAEHCYSRIPDFDLIVLDEAVLGVARLFREELLVMPHDEDFNRSNRYAAYRQYTVWAHGRLGAGNRRVIPSCCVWRIRDRYPDPYGQYKGFIGGPQSQHFLLNHKTSMIIKKFILLNNLLSCPCPQIWTSGLPLCPVLMVVEQGQDA